MRDANGRIFLIGVEYHRVECNHCGDGILVKEKGSFFLCDDCHPAGDIQKASRQSFGDDKGRHWKRQEIHAMRGGD